jgi:photosystem II stability/assembly factor-like uncharacterized protein
VLFVDDSHGWASGGGGIVATVDGGRTWSLQYRATPTKPGSAVSTGVGALEFLDYLHGWAVDAGTLIETSDGGLRWRAVGKPGELGGVAQLRFFDLQHGWAITYRTPCSIAYCTTVGTLLSTSDGGVTWTPAAISGSVLSMCWANPQVGWVGGTPLLYGTNDGGRTWKSNNLPGFYPAPADAFMGAGTTITSIACSHSTVWVFGAQGVGLGQEGYTVDRTLDGGDHWQPVLGGMSAHNQGLPRIDAYGGPIAAPAPQVAYFVGSCLNCEPVQASITTTSDGGRTFQHYQVNPATANSGLSPYAVTFADPQHGWILGYLSPDHVPTGAIYATSDAGRTWHSQYQSTMLVST